MKQLLRSSFLVEFCQIALNGRPSPHFSPVVGMGAEAVGAWDLGAAMCEPCAG